MNAVNRPLHIPARTDAGAEDWAAFLRPLLAGLNQRPSRDEYTARCVAIAFAVTAPLELLTQWRQREAMQRFKFLPSPAEVAEWLAPAMADRRVLARLTALPPPPEPRATRTAEEVEAARAKVQAFCAERNAVGTPTELPPVRPGYLSDGLLLAEYDRLARDGNGAAALRAAALRARP